MCEIENNISQHQLIFHVESDNLIILKFSMLIENLLNTDIKVIDFEDMYGIPMNKTLYRNILSSFYLSVPENELSKFLQLIMSVNSNNPTNKIRLYKLEEERKNEYCVEKYYRPFIPVPSEQILFATTFFCQKLKKSESFVQEDDEIDDKNFLEALQITSSNNTTATGYYKAISHMNNNDFISSTDTGTFNIKSEFLSYQYKVTTELTNIRDIVKAYETPYDRVFNIPLKDGVSTCHLEEYYLPYKEFYIHYANDVEIIEIYEKDADGKLKPFSVKRFNKKSPTSDFEREILDFLGIKYDDNDKLTRKFELD